MSPLPRVNPRRPFVITAQGRRRYILGQADPGQHTAPGNATQASITVTTEHIATKPVRLQQPVNSHIMVVTHSERNVLPLDAQQAIAAAALLADTQCAVLLVVFGYLNEEIAALGADQLIVIPDTGLFAPDSELHILGQLIEQFSPAHIIMADNELPDGDLGRRLAARHSFDIATHVVELSSDTVTAYQQQKSVYARRPLPRVILLDPDCVDTRLPFTGQGTVMPWEQSGARFPSEYRDAGTTTVPAAHLSLEEADFIISAGNGVRDLDAFHALADVLGAAIGASRVAVDDGRFKREQQIGATGKTVASSVYMALGISGAVQHLQGIKDCRHVIAVNTDASAPMIKRADLSIIDDAQAVAQALFEHVSTARQETRP